MWGGHAEDDEEPGQREEGEEDRHQEHRPALYPPHLYSTVQYSTVHHSTEQYSAGQYSTVQHLARRDRADADGGDDEVVEGPGPDDQIGPKLVVLKPAGHYPQDCEEDLKCFLASKKCSNGHFRHLWGRPWSQ